MNEYFQGKRVLVTGSTGFIGTNLVLKLVKMGALVRGTIHKKQPQLKLEEVEYIKCDLTNEEDRLNVCKDIDYVFMCAANSSGAAVMEKTPLVHLTPNVMMNTQMLAAAYYQEVKKFAFISSNTVYPLTDFAVKEEDANFDFFDKYFIVGWMKRFSELMCEMYSTKIKSPMQTVVIRPGNLYGPFDKFNWKESKVIAALIRRAIEKQNPFEVWGDGNDIKDFLYIDDFINGMLQTFRKVNVFMPVNIASGTPTTIREVLAKILIISGHTTVDVSFDETKPTMIPKRMININRITELTGWEPSTSMEEGLRKTIDWYKYYYNAKSPEDLE